jgi:cytochrome d ubiquinol oxidase subunit II
LNFGGAMRAIARTGIWRLPWALSSRPLAQGITLGAILQGIRVVDNAYAGGWLDWLSPFTVLTGLSVVGGYALLGATWLVWKTDGSGQATCASHGLRVGGLPL